MKKWLLAGSALLFIQIVAAAALNLTGQDFGAFKPQEKLLDFSPAVVNHITITSTDQELNLLKKDGKWLLPDYFTAPGETKKVESLMDKLAGLKQGLVVATSEGAAKRFKVSEDDFERHVILKNDNKIVADFFIGTSPGFKKVHARVADRSEVVSVLLNSYDLEAAPEDWLDRDMLNIAEDRITGLAMDNFKLTRTDKEWQLVDQADTEKLDDAKVNDLLAKIAQLKVKGLVDAADQPDLFATNPLLSFTVTLVDGERLYTFAKPKNGDNYLLKVPNYTYLFKLDNWQVDEIAKFNRESLLKGPEEEKK